MILSALQAAIAPYKLYVYGIAAVILIGLSWYAIHAYNERLREQGRQEVRAEDAKALAIAKAAADAETKRLKDKADQAEHAHDQELTDLRAYRDSHPKLSLRVRNGANNCGSGVSSASAINANLSQGAPPTAVGNEVHDGDSQPSEQQSTDVGELLGAFSALFDEQTATLREWQSR